MISTSNDGVALKLKVSVTNLLSTPVHFQGSPFTRIKNNNKIKALLILNLVLLSVVFNFK